MKSIWNINAIMQWYQYQSSIFNFLKIPHAVCIPQMFSHFHSYQQWVLILLPPHPPEFIVSGFFYIGHYHWYMVISNSVIMFFSEPVNHLIVFGEMFIQLLSQCINFIYYTNNWSGIMKHTLCTTVQVSQNNPEGTLYMHINMVFTSTGSIWLFTE